jgi:hypothetical protein
MQRRSHLGGIAGNDLRQRCKRRLSDSGGGDGRTGVAEKMSSGDHESP